MHSLLHGVESNGEGERPKRITEGEEHIMKSVIRLVLAYMVVFCAFLLVVTPLTFS